MEREREGRPMVTGSAGGGWMDGWNQEGRCKLQCLGREAETGKGREEKKAYLYGTSGGVVW